jgi:protease-4
MLKKINLKNFFLFSVTGIVFLFFLIILGIFILIFSFIINFNKNSDDLIKTNDLDQLETQFVKGNKESENKILEIPINGPIYTQSSDNNISQYLMLEDIVFGYKIKKLIDKASLDSNIKGIVLTINSPGGTIPGAQAIAKSIKNYQKTTNQPVFAHIYDICASGAYWIASTCDYIVAENGSLVGNIGVIAGPFVYYDKVLEDGTGIVTQNGVDFTMLTAGEHKDVGSPFRKITKEELRFLQSDIDFNYDLFVQTVSSNRNLEKSFVKSTIKAMIYGSNQAQRLGLIDQTGNYDKTIFKILENKNLNINDYQLVKTKTKENFFTNLLSSQLDQKNHSPRASLIKINPLILNNNYLLEFHQN